MFIKRLFFFSPESDSSSTGAGAGAPAIQSRQATISLPGDGPVMATPPGGAGGAGAQTQPKVEDPVQQQPQDAPKPAVWDPQKFIEAIGGKDYRDDDPKFTDFKNLRNTIGKAIDLNKEMALTKADLETKLAAAEARASSAVTTKQETAAHADIVALQQQLADLNKTKGTLEDELKEYKARGTLEGNPAFKAKYDAGQVEVFRAVAATAKEIGLDQAKLDEVLSQRGEFKVRKAIEALNIEDATAKQIITEKALMWDRLQVEKEEILAGKSPKKASEMLAEFEAMSAQMKTGMAKNFTEALQGQLLTGVKGIMEKNSDIAAEDSLAKRHPMFGTDYGRSILLGLEARFTGGYDLQAPEVVEKFALAETAPIWEKEARKWMDMAKGYEAQIATLTGKLPGAASAGGGGAPQQQDQTTRFETSPFQSRQPKIELK